MCIVFDPIFINMKWTLINIFVRYSIFPVAWCSVISECNLSDTLLSLNVKYDYEKVFLQVFVMKNCITQKHKNTSITSIMNSNELIRLMLLHFHMYICFIWIQKCFGKNHYQMKDHTHSGSRISIYHNISNMTADQNCKMVG